MSDQLLQNHRYFLLTFALPFFHQVCQVKTLQDYQNYSRRLSTWLLEERNQSETTASYVHMSLRVFWRWLTEEGLVEASTLVLRRVKKPQGVTPLRHTPDPQTILDWAPQRADIRLIGLLGYFFSLRPQEVLALEKGDFVAGSMASGLECCRVMSAVGLFDKLAVRVNKQLGKDGTSPPKAHSAGSVACFHERAGRELVQAVNALPTNRLFIRGYGAYVKLWSRQGLPGMTMKDLRRASLYHLGHYTMLELVALKNHARHREVSTTVLYTRRPDSVFEATSGPLHF